MIRKKKKKKLENALLRSVHYIILLPIFAGDYYRQETTRIPRKGKEFFKKYQGHLKNSRGLSYYLGIYTENCS